LVREESETRDETPRERTLRAWWERAVPVEQERRSTEGRERQAFISAVEEHRRACLASYETEWQRALNAHWTSGDASLDFLARALA
jgi:hypothetical protein